MGRYVVVLVVIRGNSRRGCPCHSRFNATICRKRKGALKRVLGGGRGYRYNNKHDHSKNTSYDVGALAIFRDEKLPWGFELMCEVSVEMLHQSPPNPTVYIAIKVPSSILRWTRSCVLTLLALQACDCCRRQPWHRSARSQASVREFRAAARVYRDHKKGLGVSRVQGFR